MSDYTIIQLAIDSVWSTIQSKELYIIILSALVMWAVLPRKE
tara:strand:- start:1110 stop:1235 length:126 start_codon:yes stop_codon:yes gene_type:complete